VPERSQPFKLDLAVCPGFIVLLAQILQPFHDRRTSVRIAEKNQACRRHWVFAKSCITILLYHGMVLAVNDRRLFGPLSLLIALPDGLALTGRPLFLGKASASLKLRRNARQVAGGRSPFLVPLSGMFSHRSFSGLATCHALQ
jgi:hypothetical protein